MEPAEFKYEFHGPAAEHNYLCAVCREKKAVLDCSVGILQPCWTCQGQGYALVKAKGMTRRFLGLRSLKEIPFQAGTEK